MTSSARAFILGALLLAATACLVLGLTMPIIRLTRFYVWSDAHSLLSIVRELYQLGEVFLAVVVGAFSIVFPFLKLLYLLAVFASHRTRPGLRGRWLRRVAWFGRWSMLDVLVLALVIFYAKTTQLVDAVSMPGVYMFTAAVVLTMIAHAMVEREIEAGASAQDAPASLPPAG